MNRSDRLMAIILLLRSRKKLSARQLAEIFEVSVRTIYRDIDSLCQAHVPIAVELGPEGGYSLLETYSLPPVMFTLDEALALFLSGSFTAARRGMPFKDAVKTALIKIEDILPEESRVSVRLAEESILFDAVHDAGIPISDELFRTVNQAIVKRCCIEFDYQSFKGQHTHREVAPYGMIYDEGVWYLVGYCHLREAERMFRLDRVQNIALTDPLSPIPKDFSIAQMQDRAWAKGFMERMKPYGKAVLRVEQHVAESLKKDWFYKHGEFEPQPDGKVVFTTYDDHPSGSALDLVRRYGSAVEILKPKEVRDQMRKEVERMMTLYAE